MAPSTELMPSIRNCFFVMISPQAEHDELLRPFRAEHARFTGVSELRAPACQARVQATGVCDGGPLKRHWTWVQRGLRSQRGGRTPAGWPSRRDQGAIRSPLAPRYAAPNGRSASVRDAGDEVASGEASVVDPGRDILRRPHGRCAGRCRRLVGAVVSASSPLDVPAVAASASGSDNRVIDAARTLAS